MQGATRRMHNALPGIEHTLKTQKHSNKILNLMNNGKKIYT